MIPNVRGLTDAEQTIVNELVAQMDGVAKRNEVLDAYYDAHNDLVMAHGGSIPPGWENIAAVLGWPAKGVDKLAERCNLEGFTIPGSTSRDADIERIWRDNQLDIETPQAVTSSLVHGVSWNVIIAGEPGEPDALIIPKSARDATGKWNTRARRLDSLLSIQKWNTENGRAEPSEYALYLPDVTILFANTNVGWAVQQRSLNRHGRVLAHPAVFKARLNHRYGRSRISRPIRQLTDSAMRILLRGEVSAEMYSIPQRVLLGATEDAFKNPDGTRRTAWETVMGHVWGIPFDQEDEREPKLQQLSQASQQPHMDQLGTVAKLCSAEMSIPVTEMGIVTDSNPASAEAMRAHESSLISLSERTIEDLSPAEANTMIDALCVAQGQYSIPDEWRALRPVWRSPEHTSLASQAQAMVQLAASVAPWLGNSPTWIDMLPVDATTKERLKEDLRRNGSTSAVLAALSNNGAS